MDDEKTEPTKEKELTKEERIKKNIEKHQDAQYFEKLKRKADITKEILSNEKLKPEGADILTFPVIVKKLMKGEKK